jgi:hypothetical protein
MVLGAAGGERRLGAVWGEGRPGDCTVLWCIMMASRWLVHLIFFLLL